MVLELDDERRLQKRMEEQNEERLQAEEREWLERVKRLEKIKEEQFYEISNDCEMRICEMRNNF